MVASMGSSLQISSVTIVPTIASWPISCLPESGLWLPRSSQSVLLALSVQCLLPIVSLACAMLYSICVGVVRWDFFLQAQ